MVTVEKLKGQMNIYEMKSDAFVEEHRIIFPPSATTLLLVGYI